MGNFQRRRRGTRSRRGMSLLEVLISIAVLVIGLSGFLQAIVTTSALESTSSEQAAAAAAARAAVEQLRATPFDQVFARYNTAPQDDPAGVVSPGANFAVEDLRTRPGATAAGRIRFPVASAAPATLREDLVDAALGLPLDLDADGVIDATDHAADYRLLPVVVTVEWESRRGPASFELRTILGQLP